MASLTPDDVVMVFTEVYAKTGLKLNPENPVVFEIMNSALTLVKGFNTSAITSRRLYDAVVDRLIKSFTQSRVDKTTGDMRQRYKASDSSMLTEQVARENMRSAMRDRAKRLHEARIKAEAATINYYRSPTPL
jgi:hypothetical protein